MTIKYDPQKVTDWLTPLEKVYARQSRQLDTYHQQLRERDKQEEEARIDLPEVFSKLAQFSSSISSLQTSRKNKKAEANTKAYAQISYDRALAKVDDKRVNEAVVHLKDSQYLKKDLNKFTEQVQALVTSGKIQQHEADYLVSLHGGKFLKEQEYIGHQLTKQMLPNWQKNGLAVEQEQTDWDLNRNNPEARKAQIRKFAIGEYARVGLKEDFVIDNFWGSIESQVDSKGVLENIKYDQVRLAQKEQDIDNDIDVARGQLNNNPHALTFQTQLHILAGVDKAKGITVEDSREAHSNRLYRLGKQGGLQQHELDLLKNGELPIPYAAGKKGELLFKPEQWQRIQQGINEHAQATVAAAETNAIVTSTNVVAEIINNPKNLTAAELQKIKEDTLLDLSLSVGTDHESYKDLDSWDPSAQVEGSYEISKAKYEDIFNGNDIGKILQLEDTFKEEPNGKVRAELAGLVTEAKTVLRAAGFEDNWNGYLKQVKDTMLTESALGKGLDRDKVFSTNQKRVQHFIAQQQLTTLLEASRTGESLNTAKKSHKEWLEGNGFGVIDGPNQTGIGMLSPDAEGVYQRFQFIRDAKIENTTKPSEYQQGTWTTRTKNTVDKFEGNIEAALNKAESFIDKEDSLGAFIEKVNEEGDPELFYSPELITKSLALGKQPSYVLKKSIEALIADKKKYGDFVEKFDLKGKLELLNDAPDLKFKEMLEELGNKDLIYSYNYLGGFTPKQKLRILNSRISENPQIQANIAEDRATSLKNAIDLQNLRKKEKEDAEAVRQGEILKKNIEGLWTP